MKFFEGAVLLLIVLQTVCCLPDGNYDEYQTLSTTRLDDNQNLFDSPQNRKMFFNLNNINSNSMKNQNSHDKFQTKNVDDSDINSTHVIVNFTDEFPTNDKFYNIKYNNSCQTLILNDNFSLNQTLSYNFTTQNNNNNSVLKASSGNSSQTKEKNFMLLLIFLIAFLVIPALILILMLCRQYFNDSFQQIFSLNQLYLNFEDLFPINFSADSILQKLPKATKKECECFEECSICLNKLFDEQLINDDEAIKLPCQHIFHKKCIKKWLNTRGVTTKCPLCAQYITQEPETEPFLNP